MSLLACYVGCSMCYYCCFGVVAGCDHFYCNKKTFIYLRATFFLDEDWEPELHWITALIKLILFARTPPTTNLLGRECE